MRAHKEGARQDAGAAVHAERPDRKTEEAADLADVAEVLQGNTTAFRGIVDRYKGLVFRLCLSYLNDREEAEEASQEIFLRAFRSLRTFSLERRFLPWLYSISSNHLKSRWSRLRKRGERSLPDEAVERLPDAPSSDPQEIFLGKDTRARVREAVEGLPQGVRDAVFMYYYEGMSVDQVSSALGVGTENVKSRLMRARKKLRESLAADATGADPPGYSEENDSGGGPV